MQGKTNKTLSILLPLALAACGGGGGDGNPAADSKPQQQQQQQQQQQNKAETPAPSQQPESKNERYTGLVGNDKGEVPATNSNSKYILNLGDEIHQLPRDPKGATQRGNILSYGVTSVYTAPDGDSYKSFHVSSDHYSYSKFGFANPAKGIPGIFFHGVPVNVMPVSGKATYNGDAIVSLNSNFDGVEAGTVQAVADFGASKLDISLASASLKSSISAKIDGSEFKGNENGKFVTGRFYGPLAEELNGVYDEKEGSTVAVFGAKR